MSAPLRILILDDVDEDAALVERELGEGGISFRARRARNRSEYLQELAGHQPDLILCDYRLPDIDGAEALAIARRTCPGIPVIVVSGTLGDERAAGLIREGAVDYVLKDRLKRLAPAVCRASDEAAHARRRAAQAQELATAHQTAVEALTILDTLQSTAPVGFGFVGRDYRYRRVNAKLAAMNGVPAEEHIGRSVAEIIPNLWPQVEPLYERVLTSGEALLDLEMSGRTTADPDTVQHWIVNLYPVRVEDDILGIGVVVVDITERKGAERAIIDLTESAVGAVAAAAEARDPYTAGHQLRVARLAIAIAEEMQLPSHDIAGIRIAGSIHDIGKIATPSEILTKPARLTANEFALIREHPQTGHDIVQAIPFPWPVADMILQHHERMDGSGYPFGIAGHRILLSARIIAVADVVEAMASHRPYRPARGVEAALDVIAGGAGIKFDAAVARACRDIFEHGRFHFAPTETFTYASPAAVGLGLAPAGIPDRTLRPDSTGSRSGEHLRQTGG